MVPDPMDCADPCVDMWKWPSRILANRCYVHEHQEKAGEDLGQMVLESILIKCLRRISLSVPIAT